MTLSEWIGFSVTIIVLLAFSASLLADMKKYIGKKLRRRKTASKKGYAF